MMKDIKPWLIMGACCGLAASSLGISINSSGGVLWCCGR